VTCHSFFNVFLVPEYKRKKAATGKQRPHIFGMLVR
jgi:hypothetical protein